MRVGDRVVCRMPGELEGVEGTVVQPPIRTKGECRTWIRWDTRFLSNGYRPGQPVLDKIEVIR
jgi:hypothetical protein